MAVTCSSIPGAEKIPTTKSTLWQEEMRDRDQVDGSGGVNSASSPGQGQAPSACSLKESQEEEGAVNGDRSDGGRKTRVESGYFSLEKAKQEINLEEQQLPGLSSPPSHRYGDPNSLPQEQCHSFPSPGNRPAHHSPHSFSLGSLDSKRRHLSGHEDSAGRDGAERGEERPNRPLSFKASRQYSTMADVPKAIRISNREAFQVARKHLEQSSRARSPGREEVARLFGSERRSCYSSPSSAV